MTEQTELQNQVEGPRKQTTAEHGEQLLFQTPRRPNLKYCRPFSTGYEQNRKGVYGAERIEIYTRIVAA